MFKRKVGSQLARSREFEWITSREASSLLKLTDRQIRRLGERGKFKTLQLNPRMTLFLRRDVVNYKAAPRGHPKKVVAGAAPG